MSKMSNVSINERKEAMLSHLLGIFIGMLSPLIFLKQKNNSFSYKNSIHVLNFKMSMLIYYIFILIFFFMISFPFFYIMHKTTLIFIGVLAIIIILGLWIFEVVVGIIGCVRSYNGVEYKYPLEMIFFNFMWSPFMLLIKAFNKTKSLLFPIKIKYWFKLGFVSLFSLFGKSFNINGINFNSNTLDLSSLSSKNNSLVTGNVVSNLQLNNFIIGLIGVLVFIASLFAIIWNYITSMFSFVFIDALVNKNYIIKKSFKDNSSNGFSLFCFRILVFLIVLFITLFIGGLYYINILAPLGWDYFESVGLFKIMLDLLPYFLFYMIFMILLNIFITLVIDFSLPSIYQKSKGMTFAIKLTFNNVKKKIFMTYLYFYTKGIMDLIINIIVIMAVIVYLIIVILIGILIVGFLFLLFFFISKILFFGVIVLFLIAYTFFGIYLFKVLTLPLCVFRSYYSLFYYEKVFDEEIVKFK
jgi:uncharacterized Tic20 family protein